MNFEVIVVDNGSLDCTVDKVKNFNITLTSEAKRGRSYARNKGVNLAKGKWIAFVDCDVFLDELWASHLEQIIEDDIFDVIQGKIIPASKTENYFSTFRYNLVKFQTKNTFCSLNEMNFLGPHCNTAACVVRKSALEEIHMFDISLNTYEDLDLSYRLWRKGKKFYVENKMLAQVFWDKGFFISYLVRSYFMGVGYGDLTHKWHIKDNIVFPTFRLQRYNSIGFASMDFLLHFTFMLGQRKLRRKIILRNSKQDKFELINEFELKTESKQFNFNPFVRILKTENEYIFKNIVSGKQTNFPCNNKKNREDIINIVLENESVLVQNKIILSTYQN